MCCTCPPKSRCRSVQLYTADSTLLCCTVHDNNASLTLAWWQTWALLWQPLAWAWQQCTVTYSRLANRQTIIVCFCVCQHPLLHPLHVAIKPMTLLPSVCHHDPVQSPWCCQAILLQLLQLAFSPLPSPRHGGAQAHQLVQQPHQDAGGGQEIQDHYIQVSLQYIIFQDNLKTSLFSG